MSLGDAYKMSPTAYDEQQVPPRVTGKTPVAGSSPWDTGRTPVWGTSPQVRASATGICGTNLGRGLLGVSWGRGATKNSEAKAKERQKTRTSAVRHMSEQESDQFPMSRTDLLHRLALALTATGLDVKMFHECDEARRYIRDAHCLIRGNYFACYPESYRYSVPDMVRDFLLINRPWKTRCLVSQNGLSGQIHISFC